jgi:nitroreductase
MQNDLSSPLALLSTRRSAKPRDLVAPGPSRGELDAMLAIASRVPDHGKLAPWRFVVVGDDRREPRAALLVEALLADTPDAAPHEFDGAAQFARQAPALVVMLFSPREGHIPLWEQELSAGAAGMNLLHAATAMGYAGGWLTGWPAYSDHVRDAFGAAPERIAGFFFLGTPARPLEDRPRPEPAAVVSDWRG